MVFSFHLKKNKNTVILQLVRLLSILKETLFIEHLTLNWAFNFFPILRGINYSLLEVLQAKAKVYIFYGVFEFFVSHLCRILLL